MFAIIFVICIAVLCFFAALYFFNIRSYADTFLLSIVGIFFTFISIITVINYSEKTIPDFVYRNDTYKIYQYKCSDNISVNTLKNDDDKFYLPESLLFVRCSGELDRK